METLRQSRATRLGVSDPDLQPGYLVTNHWPFRLVGPRDDGSIPELLRPDSPGLRPCPRLWTRRWFRIRLAVSVSGVCPDPGLRRFQVRGAKWRWQLSDSSRWSVTYPARPLNELLVRGRLASPAQQHLDTDPTREDG